ncbi:dienelactone hydrolase [Actinoplanes octamycinicus]|uniref:Dienelactone hydrolase n=1 Tax=Actinoplanes octamycinicus TaxID=135948 RepID=A0A7W7M8Z7_9ACTN|nr:alpha/beta hydrolase-fold protein [Actinoplanes octamycinicus]MBB4741392.1 dienelactone hydrolase [Actinoplanes octamycinicus]GIE62809.1 esterase [Actinoplanes octamycinicus]
MSIDGTATVLLAVLLVVAITVLLALLWPRIRVLARVALVAAVLLSVTAASLLELNRLTETYPSWAELAGSSPEAAPRTVLPGHGRLETYRVPGPASGMNQAMMVYLPAAYFTPEGARLRFPVIEALHGYPGTPESWVRRLDIVDHLDREITAGRMAPTVVLLPRQTPDRLLDTECTNLVGGAQAETYLTVDVPDWARTHLRIRTDAAAWGLIGYSAGAFCAMNLALKHPDRYTAAASLSGFADPGIKVGDHSEKTTNNIAWRLAHLPQPPIALWIGWAADDHGASRGSRDVVRLARAPLTVTTAIVPKGGHSHATWQEMEAPAFDWLSAHLARPAP